MIFPAIRGSSIVDISKHERDHLFNPQITDFSFVQEKFLFLFWFDLRKAHLWLNFALRDFKEAIFSFLNIINVLKDAAGKFHIIF
jgi:hypothetical protein